jgi:hypothetical protein
VGLVQAPLLRSQALPLPIQTPGDH